MTRQGFPKRRIGRPAAPADKACSNVSSGRRQTLESPRDDAHAHGHRAQQQSLVSTKVAIIEITAGNILDCLDMLRRYDLIIPLGIRNEII